MKGFIVGTKVWRKLHTWLVFATQDFSDTSELARQILSQAEFWVLLSMGPTRPGRSPIPGHERRGTTTPRLALKEPGRFVEGVLLSENIHPPCCARAAGPGPGLAQTEGDEKSRRFRLMQDQGISELDAALQVAAPLTRNGAVTAWRPTDASPSPVIKPPPR